MIGPILVFSFFFFFFQAEDGIRDADVTGVQTCALPISRLSAGGARAGRGRSPPGGFGPRGRAGRTRPGAEGGRGESDESEKHTSRLQSRPQLVFRRLPVTNNRGPYVLKRRTLVVSTLWARRSRMVMASLQS